MPIIQILHPAAGPAGDQPPGVMIQEVLALRGFSELGQSKLISPSASPVGVDQKYFFDSKTYAQISSGLKGAVPAICPAKVKRRTIGDFLSCGERAGMEPSRSCRQMRAAIGHNSHNYLAPTVIAASLQASMQAIRFKLGGRTLEALGRCIPISSGIH